METKHTGQANPRELALVLPGMTLNGSFFPALPMPCTTLELCRTAFGPDGGQRAEEGMDPYVDLLDAHLIEDRRWRDARRLVVAHSFGGMLAMAWYLAHHGTGMAAIDGLVLIATTAGPMYDRVRLCLGRLGGMSVRVPAAPLLPLWNHPSVTRLAKRLLGGGIEITQVDFQRIRPATDFRLDLAGWRNTDWRAMRSYRFAMQGFDVRTRLHEIRVPTIVLHGTADSLFALRTAEELAAGLPHAELRVVEGAGHGLPLTHGEEVVRAVGDLGQSAGQIDRS
jgi:pimeloyl-ACP methyl ester carboxylesterase